MVDYVLECEPVKFGMKVPDLPLPAGPISDTAQAVPAPPVDERPPTKLNSDKDQH
jgi:hypothetical protein